MSRRSAALAALALAGAGLLGLTACQAASPASSDVSPEIAYELAALDADEQAVAALGFDPVEVALAAAPAPSASASPGARRGERHRRPLARELLRGRVLHAEAVVQTKEGIRTVVSQRGSVTEVDGDSVTVKSADGFTLTWTYAENLRVVEHRRTVQPSAVAVGAEVGVAGAKDGDRAAARLIVLRR
jgi:hypothetical protein